MKEQVKTPAEEQAEAPVKEQVLEWVIEKLLSGDAVPEENVIAFRKWLVDGSNVELKVNALRRAMENRSQLAFSGFQVEKSSDEARQRWRALANKLEMNPELNYYREIRKQNRRSASFALWRKRTLRVAAVLLPAAVIVGGYLWFGNPKPTAPAQLVGGYVATDSIVNDGAEVRHITLSDGTEIVLNAGDKLTWNDHRECALHGEALFKVAKDEGGANFTVYSDHMNVEVLGTEFLFRASPGESHSTLALYEGSVQLSSAAGTYLIEGSGEFSLDHATGKGEVRELTTAKPVWADSEELYKFHSLGEVFGLIEKEYGVKFENLDVVNTAQQISFRLKKGKSLQIVMTVLSAVSGDFDYTIDGQTVVLTPQKIEDRL